MGCSCSICKNFCWHKCTGKRLKWTRVFSCCGTSTTKAAEWIVCDSLQLGQPPEDVNCESKQEPDVPPKEEVTGPESSQQLEPEFLNCAAEVSLYTRRQSLLSESSNEIKNGEKPHDVLDTEEISKVMAQKPGDCVGVDQNIKSGERSSSKDGKPDDGNLTESTKRSKLLMDSKSEVTDGCKTVIEKLSFTNQKEPENVLETFKMGDCVKMKPEMPPPDMSPEQKPDTEGVNHSSCSPKSEMSGDLGETTRGQPTDMQEKQPGKVPGSYFTRIEHKLKNPEEKLNCEGENDGIYSSQVSKNLESKVTEEPICAVHTELSLDIDEDIYRGKEDIENDKIKGIVTTEKSSIDVKQGVGPEVDIITYCQREWRGNTTVAKKMKEGYEEVSLAFGSIRRIRGDNYCALRATLFQCLSQTTTLPQWLADDNLIQLPEELAKKYEWIKQWRFWHSHGSRKTLVWIKESLELLKKKWSEISEIKNPDKKQAACDLIFQNEEEYCLYEAVKFLMLKTAIDLFNSNEDGKEVPVFSWLLFARNTSNNPCEFLKNHLNHVGHSGGLEQVEMFLLGYTLQHTIQVYRLYKYGTDEYITFYPNDHDDWPVVTLITEDDRHYNVPVRVCEETPL